MVNNAANQRLRQYLSMLDQNDADRSVPVTGLSTNGSSHQVEHEISGQLTWQLANQYHEERNRGRFPGGNMFAMDGNLSTPPPVSMYALTQLPRYRILPYDKKVHQQSDSECSVCSERLIDGIMLTRLPCGHTYHTQCIVPWLSRTCTCPDCRYEVRTSHRGYEKIRRQKMKGRKIVSCDCNGSFHHCFFQHEQCMETSDHSQTNTTNSSMSEGSDI